VRNTLIGETLTRAAHVPLEIAKCAADVADLAAEIAVSGNPNLRGDAAAAATFAASAARAAANLVEINLATLEGDYFVEEAREAVASAERAMTRALGAGESS
jgi:methenyltetrahydrofolate cyclohydrolase